MRLADVLPGQNVKVNHMGDLYMCAELRPVIGNEAVVVKVTKNGKVQVMKDGKLYSVPARNLDPVEVAGG